MTHCQCSYHAISTTQSLDRINCFKLVKDVVDPRNTGSRPSMGHHLYLQHLTEPFIKGDVQKSLCH